MANPPRLVDTGRETGTTRDRSSPGDVERLRAELEALRAEDRWAKLVGLAAGVVVLLFVLVQLNGIGPAIGGGHGG